MLHVCVTLYSVPQRLACTRLSVSAEKQKKQTRREKQATKNDGKRDGEESLQASFRIPQSAHYSVPWPLPAKPFYTGSTSLSFFNSTILYYTWGIPSMAHYIGAFGCLLLHNFFCLFVCLFVKVVLAYFILLFACYAVE